jgi:transposase
MDVVHERCCGLDVHKDTVVACLLEPEAKQIRSFRTTTDQLREMVFWLTASDCWHVAMESTGVYWKPVLNILELAGIEAIVVNASHMKAVPGRKTDVKDAEWIADLFQHGLLRGSFIPDRPQRELRELVRYRKSLISDRTREVNRVQKVLEGANIKLIGTGASDVMGVSARAMIEAMIAGETDPDVIVSHVKTHLKASPEDIKRSVDGLVGSHQRFLLQAQLKHIDHLNEEIAQIDAVVKERMAPFMSQVEALDTLPGIGTVGAQETIAAIGVDMTRFPTANHLASWASLCPGMNESAGKRKSASTGKGGDLRTTLIQAAWAAVRAKKNYYRSQYYHLRGRLGAKKAIVAVAHSLLVAIYHILRHGTTYRELGADYFDERHKEARIRQHVRAIQRLGSKVIIPSSQGVFSK